MSLVVQTTYNQYQSKGQPGQHSRPALELSMDSNGYVAGEELKPGQGVGLVTGKYIKPTDAATQEAVIGVVYLNSTDINTDGEVVITADSEFTIVKSGNIFVELNGTVAKDDPAFCATDGSGAWVTATPTGVVKNPMFFEEAGIAGDIVSVRINGLIA